jgi:hypothetical protein
MTEHIVVTPGLEPPPPVKGRDVTATCPVVVYSAHGRLALVLHRDPDNEALAALKARLIAKQYTLVESVPLEALATWAAPDTPITAALLARRILADRARGVAV